jgi:hypothetical protein
MGSLDKRIWDGKKGSRQLDEQENYLPLAWQGMKGSR